MPGTLIVVGTGIRAVGHLTADAAHWIRAADVVLHVVADAVTERAIRELNSRAVSLSGLYGADKRRLATYTEMVARILDEVRAGKLVCAVFYGHPGVFVLPSHEAVRLARAEGHHAEMLPGISAEDCLVADLGVDPARVGLATFEATDFLVRRRVFDPRAGLVLWQIGVVGNLGVQRDGVYRPGLALLTRRLLDVYPREHEVVVYEAATMPTCDPIVLRVPLADLADAPVTTLSTLYVPPLGVAPLDPEAVAALGLSPRDFGA